MDTIFALASARGKSGVSVIRISGPLAHSAAGELSGSLPAPRIASLRTLKSGDLILDEALVLVFDEGHSFTGEPVVEFQVHGSLATVDAVLRALADTNGLRLADPGEFTRRALENDRLDLAQVEGLSDLIEAETEAQRRQALAVLSGALGAQAERWRSDLIRAAALLEATIDFADEDVPVDVTPEVLSLIDRVSVSLSKEIEGVSAAERIRDGFEVAIVGPPNVGKSTLLNALAGRDAAITSDIAGTTRDVIEVHMDLGGLPVTILDTAGLRVTEDVVENLGIDRAVQRATASDLCVVLLESENSVPSFQPRSGDIVLVGKSDATISGVGVSGLTGQGVDDLVDLITSELKERVRGVGVAIRDRHRVAMQTAVGSLGIARDRLETAPELAELSAEDLRTAIRALDSLVGRIDVEHVLDEIFLSFCIGK